MNVRKWLFTDNKEVAQIESKSFSDPRSVKMIADMFMLDNFLGYVCEEQKSVIGYVGVVYCLDEAEIQIIAVEESFRRKGVAKSLLNEVERDLKLKKVKKVFLEVRRSNTVAQSLYESLGYTYVSVRKNYYQGTEDALIMSKVFKE